MPGQAIATLPVAPPLNIPSDGSLQTVPSGANSPNRVLYYTVGSSYFSCTSATTAPVIYTGSTSSSFVTQGFLSGGGYLVSASSTTTTTSVASSVCASSTCTWIVIDNMYVQAPPSEEQQRQLETWRRRQQVLLSRKVGLAKSSIKRALRLMANFGMEEDARIFLSGSTVEVSHPDSLFKFCLQKSDHRSLIHNTHSPGHMIPYNLALCTKSNVHVADLCVVMDQTPVFDQILALCMFVRSGNEEEILQTANYSNRLRDANLRQFLCEQLPYLKSKLN